MKLVWKRIICFVMIFVMTCAMTACDNEGENKSNSDIEATTTEEATTEDQETTTKVITVLTDLTHLRNTKLAEYKATFESNYENVEVQFEVLENYEQDAVEFLESGDYDVMLIPDSLDNTKITMYYEPLGTVEELSETYNKLYLQRHRVKETVYGLPRYAHVQGIAFNEVVLSKAGVIELPKTSTDFLNMLQMIKNTQPEVIPYYIGYQNEEWLTQWQEYVWGAVSANPDYRNNGIVNEVSPFEPGKPNYVVHKLLYDIVDFGLCEDLTKNISTTGLYTMLNRGEIGCMALSSSHLHELQTAGVNPDDISFMPFPYEKDGTQYVNVELDYSYAVNKNSANKDLAKEWITYMLTQSGFAKSEGTISIKRKTKLPDVLSNFSDAELIVNNPATMLNSGKYAKLNELSGIYLDDAGEKIRLIKSAADETNERFDEIMEDWNTRWNAALTGTNRTTEE